MKASQPQGVHYFAVLTACATFLLIVAGALVTSNDAGLSVPDWPLSHGQLMPEMQGGVFYEHGHRMVAATVGLLTIILNIWLWRVEPRPWVRRLGLLALLAVVAQGILGGITVLFYLPTPVSVVHATLAQLFFCMVVMVALATSPAWAQAPCPFGQDENRTPGLAQRWALFATAAVFLQLILGALLRHSGTVDGTKAAVLVSSALFAHLAGALVVIIVCIFMSFVVLREESARDTVRTLYFALGLLFLQLVLGLGALVTRLDPANRVQPSLERVLINTGHVALGALLLATTLVLTLRIARHRVSREKETLLSSELAGQTS